MRRFVLICLSFFPFMIWALNLELTQGVSSAMPIAIESFSGLDPALMMSDIVKRDLANAGLFRVISASPAKGQSMSIASWRQLGADTVLTGEVKKQDDGQLMVRFELIDAVTKGKMLLAEQYRIKPSQGRSFAHFISDRVYQKLTGEKGIFSTKIAYVLVNRNASRNKYKLEVADMDGENAQTLLQSSEPIMSPAWSPDGKKLAYVSFEQKKMQVYLIELASGRRKLITNFPGINGAPAFSPDGNRLAIVLSKSGAPKLYQIDLRSGDMTQLTTGVSIDTEPSYSRDGQSIIFTSNRGGSPQIYQLNLSTKQISRVTFSGQYNARASFTPDNRNIIMLRRQQHKYNIALQGLGGNGNHTLTNAERDESPTIAPNGRMVLYATQQRNHGVLAMVSTDGRIRLVLPSGEGDVQEPAWSPYLS
jgi:TolB protein